MCGHSLSVLFVWPFVVGPFCVAFVVGPFCLAIRCRYFLCGHSLSVLPRCAASFGHCNVGTSSNYGFLLPLFCLQTLILTITLTR